MNYRFLRFPGGKPKAVTLSYDDGWRSDLPLLQIINRYGIKCTFNINSGMMGKHEKSLALTGDEIQKYILDSGHEVAVHGHKHMAPGLSRPIDAIQDILNCRLKLEKLYGRIIRGMAYPDVGIGFFMNGASYENIRNYLQDLGIVYARGTKDKGNFRLPTDWLAWMPTAHHDDPNLSALVDKFLNIHPDDPDTYCASRYPRLFYLWGHSNEFNDHDNWNVLEDFCARMGGQEDIWYATNIEIYDYVRAYDSLIFSADGTMVHNPSLMTVWFCTDKSQYRVDPGQTLIME